MQHDQYMRNYALITGSIIVSFILEAKMGYGSDMNAASQLLKQVHNPAGAIV